MGPSRSSSSDNSGLPGILLGPGDSFCIDYTDPKRLLAGSNLPSGLKNVLNFYTADKADSDWDSDLDADAASVSDDDSDSDSDTRRRTRRRSGSDVKAAEDTVVVRRDPDVPERISKRRDDYYLKGQPPQIACLALGSRIGDYAVIVRDKGQYYQDGNIFERFSYLRQWLVGYVQTQPIAHTPLTRLRDGANVRLFLGAEGSYFACDTQTRAYRTNINSTEFADFFLYEARNIFDSPSTLKRGYVPHSVAMGPDDMICWIAQKEYKTNRAFRQMFPAIERYLAYAKAKKLLDGVHFTCSPDYQPGSKLPYYVLSTTGGFCISSVPADASDLMTKYATRLGSDQRGTKRTRNCMSILIRLGPTDMSQKASSADAAHWRGQVDNLTSIINEGWDLTQGGDDDHTRLIPDTAISIVTGLRRINEDCESRKLDTDAWAKASLADRVHMLLTTPADTPKPITDEDAQFNKQTLNKLAKETVLAARTVAGGSKGYDSDADPDSDTTAWGMAKYTNLQLGLIRDYAKPDAAAAGPNARTDLSLAQQVWALRSNQVPPNLYGKLNSAVWASGHLNKEGIPQECTLEDRADIVLKELKDAQKALDAMSSGPDDDAWNLAPLGDKVATVVNSRNELEAYVKKCMAAVEELGRRVDKEFEKLPDGELKRAMEEFMAKILADAKAEEDRDDPRKKDGLTQDQMDDIRDANRGPI